MDLMTVTEYLNAIKRTYLFCNSNDALVMRTGIPSQANNNNFDKVGADKRIAIFESFNEEYQKYSLSMKVELMDFMEEYEETSKFYKNNELASKKAISTKEAILDIVGCIFFSQGLPKDRKVSKFISTIYDHKTDRLIPTNVNIPLLLLLLYKVIPTYMSKGGIVSDIRLDYAKVKELSSECYERFGITEDKSILDLYEDMFDATDGETTPGETEEDINNKKSKYRLNRMALITLFENVIHNIWNTANPKGFLNYTRYFDIDGLWVDRKNKDVVYEIEKVNPCYQMTVLHINKTIATYTMYSLVIHERSDGRLLFETTHPRGRARLVLNETIGCLDSSSHYVTFDSYDYPQKIELEDIIRHPNYDFNVKTLFRLSQQEKYELTERIESLELRDKYEKFQTEYITGSDIFAITREFIYISSPNLPDGQLYRIPRDRYGDKGIKEINIDDRGGESVILQQGPYLGFEKIRLYIDIRTDEKMHDAGIERVQPNEII